MGSCDDAELCELIGVYINSLLEGTLENDQISLYQDNELTILHDINSQQRNKIRKNIVFLKVLPSKLKLEQI